jgi:two-component system, OmpR family, alkaline phosphatase synthesis response regulator PhoP
MKSKRVLIVDDNDLNRKLFENLIGQRFSFESAKNGLEAVGLAEISTFDLILMDIQMPQMDGITAMKKIRQGRNLSCPIFAVTALDQGFDEFVSKPIRPKEFLLLVQQYLNENPKNTDEVLDFTGSNSVTLDKKVVTHLLKYNSRPVIKKVFDEFLNECRKTEALIDLHDPESFSPELIEKIHEIKGNSGTLGAMRIYNSAAKAENYGRNENFALFNREIKNLRNELGEFRKLLNQETIFDL